MKTFAWSDLVPPIIFLLIGIMFKVMGSSYEVAILLFIVGLILQIMLIVYRITYFIVTFETAHVPTLEEVLKKLKRFG